MAKRLILSSNEAPKGASSGDSEKSPEPNFNDAEAGSNIQSDTDAGVPDIEESNKIIWTGAHSVKVTNNTRIDLSVPSAGLFVPRFGNYVEIKILTEDSFNGMVADIDAIAKLNGFGSDDFVIELSPEAGE